MSVPWGAVGFESPTLRHLWERGLNGKAPASKTGVRRKACASSTLAVPAIPGSVVEWLKTAVLKTAGRHSSVGSNPTASAIYKLNPLL